MEKDYYYSVILIDTLFNEYLVGRFDRKMLDEIQDKFVKNLGLSDFATVQRSYFGNRKSLPDIIYNSKKCDIEKFIDAVFCNVDCLPEFTKIFFKFLDDNEIFPEEHVQSKDLLLSTELYEDKTYTRFITEMIKLDIKKKKNERKCKRCNNDITKKQSLSNDINNDVILNYKPLDGLRKCLENIPDATNIDMCFQMGRLLFQDNEANTYFLEQLKKRKIRIIISSNESISKDFNDNSFDYIEEWRNLWKDFPNSIDVKVSDSTLFRRVIIAKGENKGYANIREYNNSKTYDISKAKTRMLDYKKEEYHEILNEFEELWKNAMHIKGYYEQRDFQVESHDRRMIDAYEEKERHNYTSYISKLTDLANEGYAVAINRLATCYFKGEYVEKDYSKGFSMLEKAASLNDQNAIFNLGLCYRLGIGCEIDAEKAVALFAKVAENNAKAAHYLYEAYRDGIGTQKNSVKAEYYRQRADKHSEEVFYDLNDIYEDQIGNYLCCFDFMDMDVSDM